MTIGAFLVQLIGDTFLGTHLLETLSLTPYLIFEKHYFWQFVTYMFMHADLFHILFNMLILWMIGSELEGQWGTKFFLKYYFVCGLSAGVFYLAVQSFLHGSANMVPMLGSSGAVYGLLVAYGIIYSERMMLFMMVFPMKAKHFVMILAAIEFISTVFYSRAGVANAAHLGGMVVGFAYLFLNAWLRIRAKRKKTGKKQRMRRSHLRLVVNNEVLKEFDDDDDEDEDSDPGRPTFH
ncbi:MAG: rhomboid family intramembrane serine protease [Deltaproteobacteria bacterium]|nr:rhomboid family intramembrane serine protease [Deltaproteobacteria bacterium]